MRTYETILKGILGEVFEGSLRGMSGGTLEENTGTIIYGTPGESFE